MNTDSSGSDRVDDIKGHPQGEIRGATKRVNFLKRRFSTVEGTAALFFIQIFATLGFAVLYSTWSSTRRSICISA